MTPPEKLLLDTGEFTQAEPSAVLKLTKLKLVIHA